MTNEQVWLAAWCASAQGGSSPFSATHAADSCMDSFKSRFEHPSAQKMTPRQLDKKIVEGLQR